ncbi:MAG: type II secretion system protein GspG [Patescibacteria group bacterium]
MRKGFTLIKILIIGIIGISTIIAVILIDPITQIQKANDSKRKSDLAQIQRAIKQYYEDFGKFPPNPGDCLQDVNNCKIVRLDGRTVEWGESFAPYIKILPKDPSKNKTYIYYVKIDGQSYYMYGNLDREEDPQACNSGKACSSLSFIGLSNTACGGVCNYGVSSGNVTP